ARSRSVSAGSGGRSGRRTRLILILVQLILVGLLRRAGSRVAVPTWAGAGSSFRWRSGGRTGGRTGVRGGAATAIPRMRSAVPCCDRRLDLGHGERARAGGGPDPRSRVLCGRMRQGERDHGRRRELAAVVRDAAGEPVATEPAQVALVEAREEVRLHPVRVLRR